MVTTLPTAKPSLIRATKIDERLHVPGLLLLRNINSAKLLGFGTEACQPRSSIIYTDIGLRNLIEFVSSFACWRHQKSLGRLAG